MKTLILVAFFLTILIKLNYSQVSNPYNSSEGDYLIIIPDELLPTIIPFAEWKMQKGHKVKIVTKSEITNAGFEWIADNLPNDTYVGIDGYIKQLYDEWNIYKPLFILLVGDVEHIPTHMAVSYIGGSDKIPSDMNYGCVNSSNDPNPTEFKDLYFPEIAVGRFSVKNSTELTSIINNSISFEKEPISTSTNYFKTIVFSADITENRFKIESENLRNKITNLNNDLITKTVYTGSKPDLIAAINEGSIIFNHYGHGNITVWTNPVFSIWDIPYLENIKMLPIVWSVSCLTGNLLVSDTDCLAEKFLKNTNNTGAVAVIASSKVSGGDALLLWERFYESLWPSLSLHNHETGIILPNYYLGNAIIHAKIGAFIHQGEYYTAIGSGWPPFYYDAPFDGLTNSFNEYNLFGDPALEIWTNVPCEFANVVIVDKGKYISVNTGVDGSNITVSSDFDYGKSFFEVKKGVSNAIFYTNRLPVTITITKHNYKPYIKKSYRTISVQLPKRNGIQLGMSNSIPDIQTIARNTAISWANESGYDGVVKYFLSSTSGLITWKPYNNGWQITGTNAAQVINNLTCYDYDIPTSGSFTTLTKNSDNEYIETIEVEDYELLQNYPNPFNPTTTIRYSIPVNIKSGMSKVTLKIYDVLGREVATLVNEQKNAGNYEVQFNAANLASGVYIYSLNAGDFTASKKLILLK